MDKYEPCYNDKSIFIKPSEKDLCLIKNEVLKKFNKELPNRKFSILKITKKSLFLFQIKETVQSLNKYGKIYDNQINLESYYINDMINFIEDKEIKEYLLTKYDFHMKDYKDEIINLLESSKVFFQLNRLDYHTAEITLKNDCLIFSIYNSKLVRTMFFEQYYFKFPGYYTYHDLTAIKRIIKLMLKNSN